MVLAHSMLPSSSLRSPREKPPPVGMSPLRPSLLLHVFAWSFTVMPPACSSVRISSALSKSRVIFALCRASRSEHTSNSDR